MSNEIEDVKKQLKALEDAVRELKETDLFIAKQIVGSVATLAMNIAARTLTGEERGKFRKRFDEKLKAVGPKLSEAKTLNEAFEVMINFDSEIGDFIKAAKVDTADKAMEIAHSFIKKYVPVALPLKAVREGDVWIVDIDVGALAVKVAKVKVDARTGDIISYEIPEKK